MPITNLISCPALNPQDDLLPIWSPSSWDRGFYHSTSMFLIHSLKYPGEAASTSLLLPDTHNLLPPKLVPLIGQPEGGQTRPSCPTVILGGECQISNINILAAPRHLHLEQLILDRYDSSSITISSISLQVPTLAFKLFSSFLWRPLGIGHGFKSTTLALGLTKSFPVLCCPLPHSPLTRATGPIAKANSNILHLTAMVFRPCGQCCIMATWLQPLQVSYLSLSLLSPSVSSAGCTLGPRSKHHCRCPQYPSPSFSTAGLHSTLPEQSTLWNSLP